MRLKKQCRKFAHLISILMISSALLTIPLSHANATGQVDQKKVSEWAKQVCKDLGIMSLGTMQMGVNISALGMAMEKGSPVLKGFGFKFGEGSYRISATRIDTGRYIVSIQAMSRPNDNDKKLIRLNTKADTLYPISIPAAPAGKYMWNAAIQYDMEDQLGIRPDSEMEQEPVSFVNFRVVDPAKFQASGLSGKKNKAPTQMVFKGNHTWNFNYGNGKAVYQNGQWSANGSAAMPSNQASVAQSVENENTASTAPSEQSTQFTENTLVFVKVDASGMTYNKDPFDWEVFEGQINDQFYYIVKNPEIGTALVDINKKAMFDAQAAQSLPDGDGMTLDMSDLTPIPESGVQLNESDSGKQIEAWWDNETLSFTLGEVLSETEVQVSASSSPVEETAPEPPVNATGLLFENSDFEMGDLTNWTADGNAFEFQPTKGDNPTARGRKFQPSQHQGDFWIGTFEKYQEKAKQRPGRTQGDKPTGTLTSVPFEIKADKILFRVGGGKHKDREMVYLVIDGQTVLSATGKGNETLEPVVWDVAAFKGQAAQIVIKDSHSGGWGHINVDDFRYPE